MKIKLNKDKSVDSIMEVFTNTLDRLCDLKVNKLAEVQDIDLNIQELECKRNAAYEESKKAANVYDKLFEIVKG